MELEEESPRACSDDWCMFEHCNLVAWCGGSVVIICQASMRPRFWLIKEAEERGLQQGKETLQSSGELEEEAELVSHWEIMSS